MPGIVLGKPEDKMGLRGSDTIALTLDNLRVPATNRLGAEGEGFKVALSALDAGRIGVASQALGVMRAARTWRANAHSARFRVPIARSIDPLKLRRWRSTRRPAAHTAACFATPTGPSFLSAMASYATESATG